MKADLSGVPCVAAPCATVERPPLGVTKSTSRTKRSAATSRALIEAEGRKAKYVLVTEPARDGGKIVTGRKGVARFEVFVKASPPTPARGRGWPSAIRELANIIRTLEALNDMKRGVTVNVVLSGAAQGPNVIAERPMPKSSSRSDHGGCRRSGGKILNLKSRTDGVSVRSSVS